MTQQDGQVQTTDSLARVEAVLAEHPLIDGHNDLPWMARKQAFYDFDQLDLAKPQPQLNTDLDRLRAGGVGAQFWSVYVPSRLRGDEAVSATLEQIDAVHAMVRRYADAFGLATTADEVANVFATGRIASLMGMEGGHSINNSMATLRAMYVLGARYLTLTHNDNLDWADSATDERRLGGLSPFGVEVVRELNRLGMLVDLSHVSAETMRDALEATEAPVIFSHSSARAVCDVPRNVPDDVLATLPANGGTCMVTFVPEFVAPACGEWMLRAQEAARAEGLEPRNLTAYFEFTQTWQESNPKPAATIADVVAHVEHVREVAGIDHVGLGGDYDGTDSFPEGMEDVSGYPRLLASLVDRGWSDADIAKLAGGNVLRTLRAAEDVARDLQSRRAPSLARCAPDGSVVSSSSAASS